MSRIRLAGVVLAAGLLASGMVSAREGEGDALPESLRGFSGQVRGVVVKKTGENTFAFKVGKVLRVWKNNKAKSPESLAGRTVQVGPRWRKGDDGKWRPYELHASFIRKLKAGSEMTLEINNVERSHFAILELSKEQRVYAERREGDREEGRGSEERRKREEPRDRGESREREERVSREKRDKERYERERRDGDRREKERNERERRDGDRREKERERDHAESREREGSGEVQELRNEVRRLNAEIEELKQIIRAMQSQR